MLYCHKILWCKNYRLFDLLGLPQLCDLLGLPLLNDLLGLLLDAARGHGLGHLVADVEELHLVQDVRQQRLLQVTDHLTRDQQHRQLLQPTRRGVTVTAR